MEFKRWDMRQYLQKNGKLGIKIYNGKRWCTHWEDFNEVKEINI